MKKMRIVAVVLVALGVGGEAVGVSGGGGGGGGAPSETPGGRGIDPAKRFGQGIDLLKVADFKAAEKAFGDVLKVAPKDANTNYMMGLSQLGQSDLNDARKYLRNAVKYDGNLAQARGWLGAVEAKLGDMAKAGEQKTALEQMKAKCAGTCPEAALINKGLAQVEAAIADPAAPLSLQLSGSITHLASAREGDAAYLQASGLINEGRYADALASLRAAGLVFGPHADVLTYQGFANRKLHNYDVAIAYYSAALSLDPEHRGANEYLGEYFVETGQLAKARQQLVKLERICSFGCEEAEELRRWIAGAAS